MITRVTPQNLIEFIRYTDGKTCTGMRILTAYACYGINNAQHTFYIADDIAVIYIAGGTALHSGKKLIDNDELAAFLNFNHIQSFISESMLFSQWKAVPRLLMKCTNKLVPNDDIQIDTAPPLWQLKDDIIDADADVWYADACARTNKGYGEVHAVKLNDTYVAVAYAQCISKYGIYITSVQTLENYRKKGYAKALLASFCKGDTVYLICEPQLRHFYEKCGFSLAVPICEYQPFE